MSDIKLNTVCPGCNNNTIFFDKIHYEIYCKDCGLIRVELNKPQNNNLLDNYNFNDFKEAIDNPNPEDLF